MRHKIKAFTLVEALVANLLAAVLFIILLEFFVFYQHVNHQINQLINDQEKWRIKSSILYQAKMDAGYIGCRRISKNFLIQPAGQTLITPSNIIQYFSEKRPPDFIKGMPLSDINVFRGMSTQTAEILNMPDKNKLTVDYTPKFKANELLIVSNCQHAEIAEISHVSQSLKKEQQYLTFYQNLKSSYTEGKVGQLTVKAFYLMKNTRGKSGFYEDVLGGRREELFEDD